jgi:predicted TPR repeat methyltransferase
MAAEMRRVHQLIGAGRLQEAATALNAAQRTAPRDARIFMLGIILASRAGNPDGAVAAGRRALALAPRWHAAMIELGLALARKGGKDELAEALALAKSAVALAPQDAGALDRAIAIAESAKAAQEALAWAEAGARLRPDDIRYQLVLGRQHERQKDFARAREHYRAAAAIDPDNPLALQGLLRCSLGLEDTQAAQAQAQALIERFPGDAMVRYLHALAHGQTPPTQPAPVITSLFDQYAERFDLHLVRGLKYKVPERVAQKLLELHPDKKFNLLDLGCGTGLLGVYLGPIDGFIIGVDLSRKMIEQAARHRIYARFHAVNLLDALRDTPADHYEAITCLDALIYVGDLTPVIPNALRILKPGGHFIFSCEAAQEGEPDLALRRPSSRYAHRDTAVERQCRQAGFADIQIEQLPALRMENDAPLPGFLVTARKPFAA